MRAIDDRCWRWPACPPAIEIHRTASSQLLAVMPAAISFDGADYKDEAAKLAHGERLSWMLGCNGCHGVKPAGR